MKFGGTAIDSGEKVIHVANLIKSYRHKRDDEMVGVVSAVRGITDEILSISNSVKRGDKISIMDFIKRTRITHQVIIDESISNRTLRNQARNVITQLIDELEDILEGIVLLAEVTPRSLDYLMSF
jgi:aspartate kinase